MSSKTAYKIVLPEAPSLEDCVNLEEIDEALFHASCARKRPNFSQRQRDIVDQFINDLLDTRLEFTKC